MTRTGEASQSDEGDDDVPADVWPDDEWCERCDGDGMDPMNDYLLPCPACQGEQRGLTALEVRAEQTCI